MSRTTGNLNRMIECFGQTELGKLRFVTKYDDVDQLLDAKHNGRTRRFTQAARRIIQQNYPKTKLDLDEEKRKYKWGKYGRGKYVYPDDEAGALNVHMRALIEEYFPEAKIDYFT